jgi:hypothetical protein
MIDERKAARAEMTKQHHVVEAGELFPRVGRAQFLQHLEDEFIQRRDRGNPRDIDEPGDAALVVVEGDGQAGIECRKLGDQRREVAIQHDIVLDMHGARQRQVRQQRFEDEKPLGGVGPEAAAKIAVEGRDVMEGAMLVRYREVLQCYPLDGQ